MDSYEWASEYPEVQKVCRLFQLTSLKYPLKFNYTQTASIIQNGPQCGLVALAMIKNETDKDTVKELMKLAIQKNYTYNGEIFSAQDMCDLAKEALPNRTVELYNGNLNDNKIKEFILNNGVMLVPYDSDKDHSPCQLQGHKAHWAAVVGGVEVADDFYVLARHGKSSNVGVWKLVNLALSNSQLTEFSPDRKLSNVIYKLPDGGISGPSGLKSKAVLIHK